MVNKRITARPIYCFDIWVSNFNTVILNFLPGLSNTSEIRANGKADLEVSSNHVFAPALPDGLAVIEPIIPPVAVGTHHLNSDNLNRNHHLASLFVPT